MPLAPCILADSASPAASLLALPPWALWVAGLIGLGLMVFSVMRSSRKVVRAGDDIPASEPQRRWMAGLGSKLASTASTAKRPAVDRELTAAATDLVAQLDERAERLERLIHQADARLAELRRLAGSSSPPQPSSAREVKPGSDAPGPSARTSQLYRLADEGLSASEISQTTGIAIGEVNLVLALRT